MRYNLAILFYHPTLNFTWQTRGWIYNRNIFEYKFKYKYKYKYSICLSRSARWQCFITTKPRRHGRMGICIIPKLACLYWPRRTICIRRSKRRLWVWGPWNWYNTRQLLMASKTRKTKQQSRCRVFLKVRITWTDYKNVIF